MRHPVYLFSKYYQASTPNFSAYVDKDPEQKKVRQDTGKLQGPRARELMEVAGVSIPEDGAGIPELQQFQKHMNYKIIVYDYGSKGQKSLNVCQSCGFRQKVINGLDVISKFMDHVLQMRKKFKIVTVLAHNGGGFDHQFILNYISTKTDLTPDLIMRGTKLISMMVGNVKFLDSLNYFPMALSELPKAFGFTELMKRYVPHLFNTIDEQNYIGPIPPLENYDPDNTKDERAREELMKWHADKVAKNYNFHVQKEIEEYCISDVDILTDSCLKVRDLLISETQVCPFMEATTIASACNKVYRRNFLKRNTIGIIPKRGYRWRDNQSRIAIQWMVWEEHQRRIDIQHAAKGQEVRIAGVKVDGYYQGTNQVFEFEGCYYHGCPHCSAHRRDTPLKEEPSETMNLRYEATTAKKDILKSLGYDGIDM
ncbi:hypothetical protein JTB14_010428 [Gonioctena quinquepunctata]|nr:hypothetical protein JTB14_010428 [Gonioctena quinquepunctata]